MVRLTEDRLCVMEVVVVCSVEDGIVRAEVRGLVAPVKVHAVKVKEGAVREKHYVHVDGDDEGEEEKGHGAEELVHILVSDDSEGGRVEEDVVMLMEGPELGKYATRKIRSTKLGVSRCDSTGSFAFATLLLPHLRVNVTKPVIAPLPEVGEDGDCHELK